MKNKARVEFAPDGKNFNTIKRGTTGNMWNYFNFNPDIREQIILNPQAKFRLIGETGITIGTLPRQAMNSSVKYRYDEE